jgi:hypothetical protein
VMAWLKGAGVKSPGKSARKTSTTVKPSTSVKASKGGSIDNTLSSLLALSKQIAKAEAELAQMNAKFKSLKASL